MKNNIYIGLYNDKLDIIIHKSNNANIILNVFIKKKKKWLYYNEVSWINHSPLWKKNERKKEFLNLINTCLNLSKNMTKI